MITPLFLNVFCLKTARFFKKKSKARFCRIFCAPQRQKIIRRAKNFTFFRRRIRAILAICIRISALFCRRHPLSRSTFSRDESTTFSRRTRRGTPHTFPMFPNASPCLSLGKNCLCSAYISPFLSRFPCYLSSFSASSCAFSPFSCAFTRASCRAESFL